MHRDGSANADVPVVDHVVGLTFEYDGEPQPPAIDACGTHPTARRRPTAGTQTTAYPPARTACSESTRPAANRYRGCRR